MKRFLILSGILLIWALPLRSQNGHYWNQQYGTRSMLLGGSVIGGVTDLGAVFYNPARLALVENPAFLISANVYQWQRVRVENAFGERADLSKSKFDGIPSFAAGMFKVGFLPKHHFAYTVLSRNRSDLDFGYREEFIGDAVKQWEGDEIFEGEINIASGVKEIWWGLSWSYGLTDKLSIGATGFLSMNNQDLLSHIRLRALSSISEVGIYDFKRAVSYNANSLLLKVALAYELERFNLGLTVTTPMLNVMNDGEYDYQFYFSGISVSTSNDAYGNSYQEDLKVKKKSPYSIGAGAEYHVGSGQIFASVEYFGGIGRYTLMEAEPHAFQSHPDSVVNFSLVDQLDPVFNGAVGVSWKFSEHVTSYASFSTDFSAAISNTTSFIANKSLAFNSTFSANNFHYAGGVVLSFPGADLTLGVSYTKAKQNLPRPVSLPEGNDDDIFDPENESEFKWERYRFVFSISVPFLEDFAKRKFNKSSDSN